MKEKEAMIIEKEVYGEEAMEIYGETVSHALKKSGVIYLNGDLGMGKTTLVRGMLRGMGYTGPVKSPTYTIVEPYELEEMDVFHFDLYRVSDAEELEYMGVRDYFSDTSLCLIEWPEMGRGVLPPADVEIYLNFLSKGRKITIEAKTEKGRVVVGEL